jgi:hypothetical protein
MIIIRRNFYIHKKEIPYQGITNHNFTAPKRATHSKKLEDGVHLVSLDTSTRGD